MPKSCASIVSALTLPRICGEKPQLLLLVMNVWGSPPRARGKGLHHVLVNRLAGITPACAGKSQYCIDKCMHVWDHPRVRGEKATGPCCSCASWGSPPRARGKALAGLGSSGGKGITPACAGKSTAWRFLPGRWTDHPRVRGEKWPDPDDTFTRSGSPPRARGKVRPGAGRRVQRGITPACAGKRRRSTEGLTIFRDHPRVRGEKLPDSCTPCAIRGSPPRARGKAAIW